MPISLKIDNKGGFTFIGGKLQTIGAPNTIDPLEVGQCVTVLMRTIPNENLWHPEFGFNLAEAVNAQLVEDVGLKPEDLILAYLKSALIDGEPRVNPEPRDYVTEIDGNRNISIQMSLILINSSEIDVDLTLEA